MAALADEWDDQQQQCIDVLCAYTRLPYSPESKPTNQEADTGHSQPGETQVRLTIIKVIKDHLPSEPGGSDTKTWTNRNFNFEGASLPHKDLQGIHATGQFDFRLATFTKLAHFADAMFTKSAIFAGVTFTKAAYFVGAKSVAECVDLTPARISDEAKPKGVLITDGYGKEHQVTEKLTEVSVQPLPPLPTPAVKIGEASEVDGPEQTED